MWRDYFTLGNIVGIDVTLPEGFLPGGRIKFFQGNQADVQFLSKVANKVAPKGFDIIIDGASHIGAFTKTAFWHLFVNHLKPGGLYALEDWFTGYWDDWADGKSVSESQPEQSSLRWRLMSWLGVFTKKHNLRIPSSTHHYSKIPLPSHNYGMVGFVKELIDEQGAAALTMGCSTNASTRQSRFENILITPGIVFVKKR